MAKRFGDTEIWKNQRWFRKLSPEYKLAFCYIKDQCNHAGIWNIDCSDLIDDLGINSFDINEFSKMCNTEFDKITGVESFKERVRLLDKGYLWVTGFIQFQYMSKEGKVNIHAAPVKTALQILNGLNLLDEGLHKGYIRVNEVLPEGYLTPKDKEKDKLYLVKHKKSEDGKQVVNFKAQGENLFADRDKKFRDKTGGI